MSSLVYIETIKISICRLSAAKDTKSCILLAHVSLIALDIKASYTIRKSMHLTNAFRVHNESVGERTPSEYT